MKRFLSLLLIVSLLLSLSLPAVAADAEFTDVEEGSFYEEAVYWAVENGVTYGTTETTFSPDNRATRAEVVTFLWRVAGKPEPLALENAFTDVVADDWYAASVQWAVEQGITSGTSETTFSPNKVCSRADAVTFLWRAKGRPEPDAEEGPFTDVEADSYYEKAVLWAAGTGVTAGTGETTFSPRQKCNRAQIVTFLHRYAMLQPEDPDFTEREVPVLHDSLDSTETATLRVYEDLPDVPYMSVTDFYNQFYLMGTERTEGMDFTHTGSSYVVTNFGGYAARFDVSAETITVDSLEHFTCPAYYLEIRQAGAVDENYPFVRQTDTLDPLDPAPLTLRLADYGIDLRGDATGVYLPLATLCDLFATAELCYVVYTGKKIYTQDFTQALQKTSALDEDPDYLADVMADRSEELADFTYRELCFNLDLWYGKPGQEWIHEDLLTKTFDEILTEKYPEIKEKLLSTEFADFYDGLNHVFLGILFDGGHTYQASRVLYEDATLTWGSLNKLIREDYGKAFYDSISTDGLEYDARQTAREELYHGDYYVELGDTAMIVFDAFLVDYDGWKAFYAGTGERPLEGDTVGTVLSGLERAAQNPEIKNIVLDVSCNGGGDSAALLAVEWLLTGQGYILFHSDLTGQITTESTQVDVNFDGVFDALDVSPYTHYNYGVLTSSYSFSCGNAFPWFMHEHGAMILGQQSGGGACAIRRCNVGGLECQVSACSSCIVTEEGGSVDGGCPVDADLLGDGESPYADFYDLTILSDRMNEYFNTVLDEAA